MRMFNKKMRNTCYFMILMNVWETYKRSEDNKEGIKMAIKGVFKGF